MPRQRLLLPPTVILVVTLTLAVLPRIWVWADLDPAPLLTLTMLGSLAVIVGGVALLVWLFAFAGLSPSQRYTTAGVMLAAGGLFFVCLDRVEFTGDVVPLPHFIWERRPALMLAEHLQREAKPAALPPIDLKVQPDDFPRYRGLRADGVVPGHLGNDWSAQPPTLLWRHPCGGGYSGFAVAGNLAVTHEQRGEQEVVVAYDRATGRQRWAYAYDAHFRHSEPMGGSGPRATPTLAEGDIYALGATGELSCLDGLTGEPRWRINIIEDCGAVVPEWGVTGSPLVLGEKVIVNPGIDPKNNIRRAVAAYDHISGDRLWAAGEHAAGYSSPMVARLYGQTHVVIFDAHGLAGHDPEDGRELWRHPWPTWMNLNITQPVVLPGDRLFIASQQANGGALVQVRLDGGRWSASVVWQNRFLGTQFANPVTSDGFLYGLNGAVLVCLDAATGRRLWRGGRYPSGQLLRCGDHLLISDERGRVSLVEANPSRYLERGRLPALDGKTWNTSALAGRQLFVRNHIEMACYELPGPTSGR